MNAVDCRSVPRIVCLTVFLFSGVVVAQDGSTPLTAGDDPVLDEKPLSQWLKQLRSENRGLQMRASQALSKAPANLHAQIIPQLIPVLKSERENDKFVAAQILGGYGPVAKAAIPDILPMLSGTQYERNRAAAAKALGQILKDSKPSDEVEKVTKALIKIFDDKYSDVRREAVVACGMIGPAAKLCIPELSKRYVDTEWLKDAECFLVRRAAAWTTGRMGKEGAVHIDKLISMMHGNGPVATEFVDAIGDIGQVHDNVAPNIVDKLETTIFGGYQGGSQEEVRNYVQHCLVALGKCGAKAACGTELLMRILAPKQIKDDPARAVQVLKTLGEIGPGAAKAVSVIESNCLKSQNKDVVSAGSEALKKIRAK